MNSLAFAIGSAMAGIAGAILSPIFAIYPYMGEIPMMKGFIIVVLGGLGSIPGAIISGLSIGIIESICSAFISPAYKEVYSFILLIAILLVRPRGIFGEKERAL